MRVHFLDLLKSAAPSLHLYCIILNFVLFDMYRAEDGRNIHNRKTRIEAARLLGMLCLSAAILFWSITIGICSGTTIFFLTFSVCRRVFVFAAAFSTAAAAVITAAAAAGGGTAAGFAGVRPTAVLLPTQTATP